VTDVASQHPLTRLITALYGGLESRWKELLLFAVWVALFVVFLPMSYHQKWAWDSDLLRAAAAVVASAAGSTLVTAYVWVFLKGIT
jgi:glucose-6-phosphate-specific signal transduction histidine kinase